jgi:uncharacterized protein YjiS (DUF1127 family)
MALNARPAGRSIGLLAHLGKVFAPAGLRRHGGALETIDDHLLKDIGRARGACGFDRRNTTGF